VLPVENTLGGIVQEVNDLLWEMRGVRITAEHAHPIRHCLIGSEGDTVRRALSHPQALAQTRLWLEAHAIEPVPFHDTAGAVRHLALEPTPGLGAIAAARAAHIYGLAVLADGIQDDDSNQTRFLLLEPGIPARPAEVGGPAKLSLCFIAAHAPGSLVAALQCFAQRGVNLSRLESRPIAERPFEYRFFLDAQVDDSGLCEAALVDLESCAREVRVFGTYPSGRAG